MLRPKYGHFVKELDLESIPYLDQPRLLAFLAGLTSTLDHLVLPSISNLNGSVSRLPPKSNAPAAMTHSDMTTILRSLVCRAKSVSIKAPAIHSLRLCFGQALKSLQLKLAGATTIPFPQLAAFIASCSLLADLDVEQEEGTDPGPGFGPASALLGARKWPPVRRLRLKTFFGTSSLRYLAPLSAPTLVGLDVDIPAAELSDRDELSTQILAHSYPALASINFVSCAAGFDNLAALSPSLFPTLRRLEWGVPKLSQDETLRPQDEMSRQGVVAIATQIATAYANSSMPLKLDLHLSTLADASFVTQELIPLFPPSIQVRVDVVSNLADSTLPVSYFCESQDIFDYRSMPLPDIQVAVRDSLRAIGNMADLAIATGDRFQLAKLGEALQECEWMRYNARM